MKYIKTIFFIVSVFFIVACSNDEDKAIEAPNTENTVTSNGVQESNLTNNSSSNILQGGQNHRLDMEVIEYGFGFATWNSSRVTYGLTLYNPNKEAVEFPTIRITARREDKTIIGTEDVTLMIIYPEQKITLGDMTSFDVTPNEVYLVQFEVLNPSDWNWTAGRFIDFEAINLSMSNNSRGGYSITGDIFNPNERDFERLRLSLVLRNSDGDIIGGDFTFIDGPSANRSVPFQIDIRDSILQNIDGEWEAHIHAITW